MSKKAIKNNFIYRTPEAGEIARFNAIGAMAKRLAEIIEDICPTSREKSLAMTKLDECVMWANASVASGYEDKEDKEWTS